jgi:subtilase family serine protease
MITSSASAAPASASGRTVLAGSATPAVARAHQVSAVPASTSISFDAVLTLRDAAGAAALVKSVSDPSSANYRHYVTAAQWESTYSPSQAAVSTARAWLKSQGFQVGAVSADRITIAVTGTAAQIERAFDTQLGNYVVAGHTVREAATNLSEPSSIAGTIEGFMGVNQNLAQPASATASTSSATPSTTSSGGSGDPAPPGAFITAPPCGSYYGAASTTTSFPAQHPGYPATVPDTVCGYVGSQLRSAYNIPPADTGAGETIAIIDAYDSATIGADATQYFAANDPSAPFGAADFTQADAKPFDDQAECGASGWQDEEAIDVESAHSLAPDAHILYVGAQDCINGLFAAEQYVIDNGLANVVSNSWGDTGGDLLDDVSTRTASDDLFMMADSTGITVQFSSGDDGDNFALLGVSAADYPASSPYVTAVGGTSLQIGSSGQQLGSVGWSTGKSVQCEANVAFAFSDCTSANYGQWLPPAYDGASGGFTSYNYTQPYYQAGVVPTTLSERNSPLVGPVPLRVEPDISLDADPATGFLIGLHEIFPGGKANYGQTRYGGTSLASPILAGIIADTDQVAGVAVGFLNPAIYKLDTTSTTAIQDVLPAGKQAQYRNDFLTQIYGVGTGLEHAVRELSYSGTETYCDGSGNCASRPGTQVVTPGYDALTGLGTLGPDFVSDLAAS